MNSAHAVANFSISAKSTADVASNLYFFPSWDAVVSMAVLDKYTHDTHYTFSVVNYQGLESQHRNNVKTVWEIINKSENIREMFD